jgi:hypothetical protein
MASRFPILAIASLFFCALGVPRAHADSITLTSGGASLPWDDASSLSLQAPGLVLTSLFVPASVWPQSTCFRGCAPGTQADLSAVFGGGPNRALGFSYFALVNGVTYEPHEGPALRLFGELSFDAGEVTVPPLPPANPDFIRLTTAFVFHGNVAGFTHNGWDQPLDPEPVFDLAFTGRGTATMSLISRENSGLWSSPEVHFAFEDQTPVPEPASVMLVCGGLGALLAHRRARRFRK